MSIARREQRPIRVVIADDDEPFRLLMRTLLEVVGVEVVGEAADGVEAVRLAERERPDVCLMDVNMPHLDGPTAVKLIRALRPDTRTMLHTASPYGSAQARAVELGLRVHDKADFETIVQELLERRPAGRQLDGVSGRL